MTILIDGYDEPYTGYVFDGCFGKEQYNEEYEKSQSIMTKINKSNRISRNKVDKKIDTIDLCDFGYCISVHKAQGSEFKKVILFQEKSYYWDEEFMRRFNYTAITRAKEKLFIITP
jgi:ATP-dependent exoDNAse (exonuclease V) alpha subunit